MVREAMDFVKAYDPELGNMIEAEYKRQQRNIELIASENIGQALLRRLRVRR